MQGNHYFCIKNLAPFAENPMYKKNQNRQITLKDFNQPLGLKLNPENKWIKKAAIIPWEAIEKEYADLFPSGCGMPAKPLRMALGALLIQKKYDYSDRELVEQIQENPYYQYFIGLPGFQLEQPFAPSLLVEFRKRLTDEKLAEINEMIIKNNKHDDDNTPPDSNGDNSDNHDDAGNDNDGTLIIDASCAPQNIAFPQDVNLLNEARENLEEIIISICYVYNLKRPRMYRKNARKDYLSLAKSKKRTSKKIRKAIKKQLQYIRRDRNYINWLSSYGYCPDEKQMERLEILDKLVEQQQYMYDNKTHTVENRIVSISQPYIRPIVRGKSKAPVEFGAKLDFSVENGLGRIEKISFEAYNESEVLIPAIENYYKRNGHYPERVLADKIYRNRINLVYCKEHGIRLAGPALGRPGKDTVIDKRAEYIDSVDRIEARRKFGLSKHSHGLGLIMTKREDTTRSSIVLSIISMNLDSLLRLSLFQKLILIFSRYNCCYFLCESIG